MYRIILVVLAAILAAKAPAYAQHPIYESLHGPDESWIVTDALGNSVDLVGDMQPDQILLVLPVNRNGEDFLSELTPFEEVLEILGESGTQELSIALVEVSGHDLTSDSWASNTSIPIYSGQSATLTTPAYDGDSQILYTSIQKLSDGTFIEAWRTFYGLSTFDWWDAPLFSILYQSDQYFNFEQYYYLDGAGESFLTLNTGFPALDESWCAAVGCQIDNLENYELGSGASESNPESWQPYGGLVGTSQDGTIVMDPLNPENRVLELKTDSINGDVGFANKHLHAFGEYEVEFDLLRRENKAAFFIGFYGEFGATVLGNDLGYTNYFGRLYITEQGEASTYWYERRGVDLNVSAESWHHVKIGSSNKNGFYIEIDGDIVWAVDASYGGGNKFSAMNFWAPSGVDTEFLIDNVLVRPIYRKNLSDFEGCSNPNACNYNLTASSSTFLCEFPEPGKNCAGDCVQDSDNDGFCDGVVGCIEPDHPLYDPSATIAEECCTVFEHASSYYADLQKSNRILRQSAWTLSRIVVTDSLENEIYFDSGQEWNALEDFQADDKYLFQQQGENNLLSTGSFGLLEYDNLYVSQNHLLGYGPEFGVYSPITWNVNLGFSCAPNSDNLFGDPEILFLSGITGFSAGFESLPWGSAEERPSFLGATDAQGYNCSNFPGWKGFVIKTLNDSTLIVKSPLADNGTSGVHGLITFKAEPHDFPFCVLGCTDSAACNYESHATFDDGTCTFFCESGCTDEDALNYDPSAVIDDGSCNYFCGFASIGDLESAWSNFIEPGLLFSDATHLELGANSVAENSIVVPQNFQNSAGGAFPIASFTPTSISGLPPGMQTALFPLNGELSPYSYGCIRLEGVPENVGVYNVAVEGDLSVFFGTLEQDFGSFIYNWVIVVSEGQDPILGCTYPDASNFVSYANDDDGSCVFDTSPELCPADFDGNGQVGTPDLLEFLSYFGTICD